MGEPGGGVYCICSGCVALRRLDENGNSVLLQLAYSGDTLGYECVLTGSTHRCDAEAVGPAKVCHIDAATVRAVLESNPALGLQFLKRTTAKLADAQERLLHNATLTNRTKLAHLLVLFMDRHGSCTPAGACRLELPVAREDLASMIGIRKETLSRIIGRLNGDGVARFSGRVVEVPRLEKLIDELKPHLL